MAISRYDLGKSLPRSQARSMAMVIYEPNHPIYLHYFCLVQIGPCILGHRQYIIWPWNFEVKVNAEFKEQFSVNLVATSEVIVAQTDSKYGINTCITIYFFYFRLDFNLQITMKHSGHWWAYFSTKILSIYHWCLASNTKSYFALYKRHFI